jgi:hypothetical protein
MAGFANLAVEVRLEFEVDNTHPREGQHHSIINVSSLNEMCTGIKPVKGKQSSV